MGGLSPFKLNLPLPALPPPTLPQRMETFLILRVPEVEILLKIIEPAARGNYFL